MLVNVIFVYHYHKLMVLAIMASVGESLSSTISPFDSALLINNKHILLAFIPLQALINPLVTV